MRHVEVATVDAFVCSFAIERAGEFHIFDDGVRTGVCEREGEDDPARWHGVGKREGLTLQTCFVGAEV